MKYPFDTMGATYFSKADANWRNGGPPKMNLLNGRSAKLIIDGERMMCL